MQPVFDIQDDPAPVEVLIPILWLMHEGRKKKNMEKDGKITMGVRAHCRCLYVR